MSLAKSNGCVDRFHRPLGRVLWRLICLFALSLCLGFSWGGSARAEIELVFGTYADDKPYVQQALKRLHQAGQYPDRLF